MSRLSSLVGALKRSICVSMGILAVVLTVHPSIGHSAVGSEQEAVADGDGWPLRYPVVVCGPESGLEFLEADPDVVKTTGAGHTKGPIIPHGTRRLIYVIIDMENQDNPYTQEEIDDRMGLIEAYWERMSHGRIEIELTSAGRVRIPFRKEELCDWSLWSISADDQVGQNFDHYQYDGRIYFFSPDGPCHYKSGLATVDGNPGLPIYTGGFANQSFIFDPSSVFTIAHELGHNFGLRHGSTPNSSQQVSDEYGDCSTIMGRRNDELPKNHEELRGLHGVNRVFLGWLDPVIEMTDATYTLYASELEDPEGPQILAIPHPWTGYREIPAVFFLSYRSGIDGILESGGSAPLQRKYTHGVGLRLAYYFHPSRTYLFRVLANGESFFFPDPYHWFHCFFSVHQISHDREKVTFEVTFHPLPWEESLTAGSCANGIDDDDDGGIDFGGGLSTWGERIPPEGIACMMPWDSILAPATVTVNQDFYVVCESEIGLVPYVGPVGEGHLETIGGTSGRYVGRFATETCGEHTYTCGSVDFDVIVADHLETTVEVQCPAGKFCFHGECAWFPGQPRTSWID